MEKSARVNEVVAIQNQKTFVPSRFGLLADAIKHAAVKAGSERTDGVRRVRIQNVVEQSAILRSNLLTQVYATD